MRKLKLDELKRDRLEDYRKKSKRPIVIVLDNIRSALNVGSAFRTADAFALEQIVLCGISAQPPHRDILKTAIGATESVEWSYEEDTTAALKKLRSEGYQIIAVEQTDESLSLADFQPGADYSYALVFGNEVDGVGKAALQQCDLALEVPQFGTKHSLNISVCVGVVCWDFVSKLK